MNDIAPGETVILSDYYRRFGKIVTVSKVTEKCVFYKDGPRETRTDKTHVVVRNATEALHSQLKGIEADYDRRKAEMLKQMKEDFDARCAAAIQPIVAAEPLLNGDAKMAKIKLNAAEVQSGLDRVRFAEGLIQQLPATHDGRNTWLLNYGTSDEAVDLRNRRGVGFDAKTKSAITQAQTEYCPDCGMSLLSDHDLDCPRWGKS